MMKATYDFILEMVSANPGKAIIILPALGAGAALFGGTILAGAYALIF